MSQVSDKYRHRVRSHLHENGLRARRPYFGAVLRRRHRLAKGPMVQQNKGLGPDKLEASLIQR
jgi:hypothetical protein